MTLRFWVQIIAHMRRLPSVALLVVATVLVAAACGGAGKVSEDHVSSCMQDSGKFRHIQTGSQVQYTGSEGGVQAVYTGPDGVTVNVLIGQDAGEASNLKTAPRAFPHRVGIRSPPLRQLGSR